MSKTTLIAGFLGGTLVVLFLVFSAMATSFISGMEAKKLVKEGAFLLDVRTPDEYRSGHVEGAVNIPVQVLSKNMDKLPPKDRKIVTYCAAGVRAERAKKMLERSGYVVYNMGGVSNWDK